MNKITSISDVVSILKNLQQPEQGKTRFFRGQADKSWDLLPSIYRKDKPDLIKNEDKIIKDALTNCPDDFSPSDTLFEKLVKLQHYGYRTRLLDLTANVLVALYFACWNSDHHDKDGELIILDIPDEQIKYDDSDTVAILSALSLRNQSFNLSKIKIEAEKIAQTRLENKILDETHKAIKRLQTKQSLINQNPEFEKIFNNLNQCLADIQSEILLTFNEEKEIIALLHDIRTDKSSFRPVIEISDLSRVLCVRAKMNNARISRQQGCFLIYGIDENKLNPAKMPNDWLRELQQNEKFIINAESKKEILQELKSFGISTRILFPELEKQAEEIMSQY
ncbi:FRG domain-containing protein [[Pasteurella] aerogenes]